MNNVNPYEWLKDVIETVNEHLINKISELLPHNWKQTNSEQQAAEAAA